MAEQSSGSVPQKSADEVKVSPARAEAEKSSSSSKSSSGSSGSHSSSHGGGAKTDKPQSKGEGKRAHPMQGRSGEYVTGVGAEAHPDFFYRTDDVNREDHFNR